MPSLKTYITLPLGLLLFSSSVSADTGLKIDIDRCNDIDADEIAEIVAVDFREANEGKSTITISCEGEVASLRMLEAGTTEELRRSVVLTDIDPVARPRTLALLVVELLEAWQPDSTPLAVLAAVAPPEEKPAGVKNTSQAANVRTHLGLRQQKFTIGLGLGFGSRSFGYRVPAGVIDAKAIRAFDFPVALMSRLSGQVFPFTRTPSIAGLGLSGRYDTIRRFSASTSEMVDLSVKGGSWDFNLRYQRILDFGKVGADLGIGNERFKFTSDSPSVGTLLDEVPGTNVRYTRLAVDADFPLTARVGLVVDLEYRIIGDIGDLADKFVETEVVALAGELSAHYWFRSDLRAHITYGRSSYVYTFRDAGGVTEAAADDAISSFLLGLSMQR